MKTKIFAYLLTLVSGFSFGFFSGQYMKKIPDCVVSCPQCPDLKVQSIDIDKMKKIKGLTINQNFTVRVDSATFFKLKNCN